MVNLGEFKEIRDVLFSRAQKNKLKNMARRTVEFFGTLKKFSTSIF